MKSIQFKTLAALLFVILHGCSNDDDFFNDYEVDITLTGEVDSFYHRLSIYSLRNDGNGNFNRKPLLYATTSNEAPTYFIDQDLESTTYKFITSQATEHLGIDYENGILNNSNAASMSIMVVVKRDGSTIDNFTLTYDETTDEEEFNVAYNSDNSGLKCYCREKCLLLENGDCN